MVVFLRRLLAYDEWANREALASLTSADAPPSPALRVFAHVIGAESLWLDRLQGQPPRLPVWPELDADGCRMRLDELARRWSEYLDRLTPARLSEQVAYVNSKGESWKSSVEDVLTHVVIHSAHHRGQVAAALRAGGATPAYTDFIHCVRQGLLD